MIRHIVLFKFKPFKNDEEKQISEQEIKEALLALKDKINVLKSIEVGINTNPKESYNLALTTTFDNYNHLREYASHPEHLKVVELIKPVKEERACVDFEI